MTTLMESPREPPLFELDTAAPRRDNPLPEKPSPQGPAMRNAVIAAAALAALWMPQAEPARAHEVWPAIPAEQGLSPVNRVWGIPWRCSDAPVANFYHGAYYREPPAVFLGYAYRPHYRYTAWRAVPRTYACAGW
jgi:hypothetical protein